MADSGNIKVVVRCRPLNSRERNRGASKLIDVNDEHQLVLNPPDSSDSRESNSRATKKKAMPFSFDRAYDENTEQRTLFEYVGVDLLEHSFNGFNTCVFAYGQTGSGKSHSMVGYAEAKGLIPLTCSKLFDDAGEKMAADPNLRIRVEVSYIEIYNEKVRDLLNPKNKGNLKVREHPSLGPYVEDLSKLVVSSFSDVENLMDEGNKARTVAATNMNETSSRSHAVFTLVVTQRRKDEQTGLEAEKVSRISLVDLAGSERANSTGATGSRLKEGANINRSLTTLGKVIAALATASSESTSTPRKKSAADHVPYRDSVLTWLLKDSLGGNSKTAMIAAISPADYEETLSTLRYADQAKKIKNKAVVNEDPNAKLIRELKEELEMLRARAGGGGGANGSESVWDPSLPPSQQVVRYQTKSGEIKTVTKAELQEQMEQNEKLMSSLNESWEEKLQRTQEIQQQREKALEELGITIDKGNVGVHAPKNLPHLVNLNEDALMNECLIYQLKPGTTIVGNLDAPSSSVQIRLSGSNILAEHCRFENDDGVVTLHAMPDSMTMVNGKRILPANPKRLRSGYRVILGDFHVFRVNNPSEVRKARAAQRPDSPASEDGQDVDWTYARREAIINHLNGQGGDVGLDHLSNEDLDRLFDDISRVRNRKAASSRPESRLSSALGDGSESSPRPYSMSTWTDDTSLDDPWSDGPQRPQQQAATTTEGKSDPALEAPPSIEKEAAMLRARIEEYEEKFQQLGVSVTAEPEEPPLTPRQRQVALEAVAKWRTRTTVAMAEDMLSHAAALKEANVIARQLNKGTTYQFVCVDAPPLSNPTSTIESIAGCDDVGDADLATCVKPCVAVRVVDAVHHSVYTWSIANLEVRLAKMRNLTAYVDRPEYSQHFNWGDPFYESPAPAYVYLGAALVPLMPLSQKQSVRYASVPILATTDDERVGECSVEVKFVSLTAPPRAKPAQANGSAAALVAGYKLGLQITVDEVTGISSAEYHAMHAQLRLSSIAGAHIERDDCFASAPVEGGGPTSGVKLRKTVGIVLTEATIAHLKTGFAAIEFHIKPTDRHLQRVLARDVGGDSSIRDPTSPTSPPSSARLAETELIGEERHDVLASLSICELDDRGEYQPVALQRQRKGRGASASTSATPAVSELRQGLQRRIVVHLVHDSGHQLEWTRIAKLTVGNIRLMDAHDGGGGSDNAISLALRGQTVDFNADGTSTLRAWAAWDSSAHDSVFLNRVASSSEQRVVLIDVGVELDVKKPTCASPPKLTTTMAVCVRGRDSAGGSMKSRPGLVGTGSSAAGRLFSSLISGSGASSDDIPTSRHLSTIFTIKLTPPSRRSVKTRDDLWRLDTASRYVRGQEALGGWRAKGPREVQRHREWLEREVRRVEVEGWRRVLESKGGVVTKVKKGGGMSESAQREVLARVVELWLAAMPVRLKDGEKSATNGANSNHEDEDDRETVIDLRQSSAPRATPSPTPPTAAPPPAASKPDTPPLVPHISGTDVTALCAKPTRQGVLHLPDASAAWTPRLFVLARPYLLVFPTAGSSEQDGVLLAIFIGAHGVRVEAVDEMVEEALFLSGGGEQRDAARGVTLALYTASNSYMLRASSRGERDAWIAAIAGGGGTR